ncbi:MAG: zinc ribbon domain-containing protein [Actinomycetes bacterium]
MPVYEFTCDACGETFEIISSLADRDEKAVCPACGGREVKAVFSSVSLGGSRSSVNPGVFVRPNGPGAKPYHSEG